MYPTAARYKDQQLRNMTRADMLIALYEKALHHIGQAIQATDRPSMLRAALHAQRVVLGIQEGLNVHAGEVPRQIDRLCTWVNQQLLAGEPEALRGASAVLSTLKSAFETVRPDAVARERCGQIPPLEPPAHVNTLV